MSEPQTLGEYRKLSAALFGEESEPVKFLDGKIAESPNGVDEKVIAHSSQMLYLLSNMAFKETPDGR